MLHIKLIKNSYIYKYDIHMFLYQYHKNQQEKHSCLLKKQVFINENCFNLFNNSSVLPSIFHPVSIRVYPFMFLIK